MMKIDLESAWVFVKGFATNNSSNDDRIEAKGFYIGKYPVSVQAFKTYSQRTSRKMPPAPPWGWDDEAPVVHVSWYDAQSYCKWLSKQTGFDIRLPNKLEWQFAAKGGLLSGDYSYAGSNKLEEVAWFGQNTNGCTHTIGKKKPNELSIYDMSGNVWEWCLDNYSYILNDSTDQQASLGQIICGGSWRSSSIACRWENYSYKRATERSQITGFRLLFESLDH